MKTPEIAKAMGFIDEELVSEAISYKPKPKKKVRTKILAAAACIGIVITAITALPFLGANGEDPNWDKTHFSTESAEVMAALCEGDLLIDKIALPKEHHSEYLLEIREGGSFEDFADFSNLSASVNYGESIHDSEGEQFFCFISFDGNADGVYIDEHLRSGEFKTEEISVNGYKIKYAKIDPLNKINTERIFAEFEYGGYKYYVSSESPDPEFFENMMEYMLG